MSIPNYIRRRMKRDERIVDAEVSAHADGRNGRNVVTLFDKEDRYGPDSYDQRIIAYLGEHALVTYLCDDSVPGQSHHGLYQAGKEAWHAQSERPAVVIITTKNGFPLWQARITGASAP